MQSVTELLFSLRQELRSIPQVPVELEPPDMAAGYAAQRELCNALCAANDGRPMGYKVALTSATAQSLVGYPAPVFGTMLSSMFWRNPAKLQADQFTTRIIETEFGFRIGRDVPPGKYSRAQIAQFVAAVVPSIELVDHRFAALDRMTAPVLAADNAIHGGWIQGEAVADWPLTELYTHEVSLRINGVEELTGAGDRVLGHPLEVLAWLATELSKYGESLSAGDYVTTGLATDGIYDACAGDNVVADFGALGQVTVDFV
jgi:2-keto-4-pentenoate hydratase